VYCASAGVARLGFDPGEDFMEAFVDAFMAADMDELGPQTLSTVINGELLARARQGTEA
jgi:hypothetical protein